MTEKLRALPDHATITLSSQQYNDLIERVLRLEHFIMVRDRDAQIKRLCAIEESFGLEPTRGRRVR